MLTDKTITLNVELLNTINIIRSQHLIFAGKQLENGHILNYNIHKYIQLKQRNG